MISLSSLLLEQVILHIMHLKLKSWQWRRIQMECLSSRIMRQTVIFLFWREKVMNMIRRRVMSTRIMDYDFSGMNSEIRISIIGKKGIDIKMKNMLVVYYSWSNGNTKKLQSSWQIRQEQISQESKQQSHTEVVMKRWLNREKER